MPLGQMAPSQGRQEQDHDAGGVAGARGVAGAGGVAVHVIPEPALGAVY